MRLRSNEIQRVSQMVFDAPADQDFQGAFQLKVNRYIGAAVGGRDGALNHAIIIIPNDNREWGKWLIMIMMMETVDSVGEAQPTVERTQLDLEQGPRQGVWEGSDSAS
ncbi:unnamed protein product [Pleuronectes platessa]|uniref:Uncharacterized protein n=1 Tax=Pleuronectes platessa TaxID=8262 RepID=A0A9N7Z5H0_PLEPL|nr:unnamed protein product [Pleuronectes platessa]